MKKPLLLLALLVLFACTGCSVHEVVIYTDVDRHDVLQLFQPFTEKTGIPVTVMHFYEVENLVDAIVVDDGKGGYKFVQRTGSSNPDLMFSTAMFAGEAMRARDALQSYLPNGAQSIPAGAKAEDLWYGIGPRAWVLMWNTQRTPQGFTPTSLMDLASDRLDKGRVCMVPPNYSPYYASALAAVQGNDAATSFYQTLIDRQTVFIADPEQCAQRIAQGDAQMGLTTLDAALTQQKNNANVAWVLPDQAAGQMGAYAQFYSFGLLKNASHPDDAKLAEDYLLSLDAEKRMVSLGLSDATLRDCGPGIPVVVPLSVTLDEASRIYNHDLAGFMSYFHRYDPAEGPQPTASAQ